MLIFISYSIIKYHFNTFFFNEIIELYHLKIADNFDDVDNVTWLRYNIIPILIFLIIISRKYSPKLIAHVIKVNHKG